MQGYNTQAAAQIIAENVVSAYVRARPGIGTIGRSVRDIAMGALMQALLRVLPTEDGALLTDVCNIPLDDALGGIDPGGPRVEAIDPDDSAVTMRAG